MKSLQEIQDILAGNKALIRERYNITNMALFGSMARGEAGPDSDIDILVDLEKPVSLLTFVDAEYFIGDLLGVKVDLVPRCSLREELKDRVNSKAIAV